MTERSGENGQTHVVRFTSLPPEVDAYFQSHRNMPRSHWFDHVAEGFLSKGSAKPSLRKHVYI